jgi:hypothetical protein
MLRRFAFAAAFLLMFTVPVWAQGFSVLFLYLPWEGSPLTTTCNGSTPIPDGRTVKIFWDADSDGPDLTDPQPIVCDEPPMCDTGPPQTVNYNQFTLNGAATGHGPGYFEPELLFTQPYDMPTPPRFYLRVYDTDGTTLLWTSAVKTVQSGIQDIHFAQTDWTCGSGGPQCLVRDEHE